MESGNVPVIDASDKLSKIDCMPVTRGRRVNVFFEEEEDNSNNPRRSKRLVKVPTKMMEIPPFDDSADVIDVTCGVLQAKLHRQRFICPGINRDCIEYDGHLVTPKTFYILADKGSLKDWKNAIRINGKKIRRYLDSGILDFYNHNELCTGRCKSRLGNKSSLLAIDDPLLMSLNAPLKSSSLKDTSLNTDSGFNSSNESVVTDSFGEPKDVKPTQEELDMSIENSKSGQSSENQGLHPVKLSYANDTREKEEEDEDQLFWRAIVQLGLVDEFFREIKSKLDMLKFNMVKNFVNLTDAKKASTIVNELGMKKKLDMKLCAHKYEFDKQRNKLEREMEVLKKKVSEYEQKKEILKIKSDCFDSLMAKKAKMENSPQTPFTFETASGRSLVCIKPDQRSTEDRLGSESPIHCSVDDVSAIKEQRDMVVAKKRKGDSGIAIPTKLTIDTPNGPTTVVVSHDNDSGSSRATSPVPYTSQDSLVLSPSQDSSNETSLESLSQESVTV